MNFARRNAFFLLAALGALLVGACATQPPITRGVPTVMVALRVSGGGAPSAEQIAQVHRAVAATVADAGLRLAENLERADYILTATLTPDQGDPTQGHLAINGVERVGRSPVSDTRLTEAKFAEMRRELAAIERWAESRSAPPGP